MKTRLFKTIAAMVLLFTAIPMHSQNYLKIWFKDGHTERHFMHLVQSISTTKYDLEGNLHSDYQMQQIVTPDTTYSYYIADIDSMSFRKVDEEQIINNVKTAISAIGSLFEQFSDSLSIARHIDDIQNIEGIANISLTETDMAVQIKDWRTLFFHFPHDGEYDSEEKYVRSIADFSERLGRKARLVQTKAPTINNPVKVAFINQQSNDISREYVEETWKRIVDNFNRLGFDATYIPSEKVTIKLLQEEMFDYDMVCLKTHGGYVNNKHWLLTGEVVDKSWFGKLFDSFDGSEDIDDVGVTEARWTYKFGHLFPSEENVDVYYKVISEDVIAKGNNRFFKDHNTVIFNSACSSLKGNFSLANMLVDEKGLDVYWGYDDTSDSEKNVLTAEYIFDYILNGCSADGAMNYLRSRHNEPDPGYTYHKNDLVNQYNRDIENGVVTREYITNLNLVTASQDCNEMSITKCKTIPTADEVAQKEYKESQKVNLIGLTTMLDKDNNEVKCGFVYSLDPTFADFNFVEASDIKESGSSDGNVIFTAALTPPSLYQKVYYHAATYDGVYYNYDKSEPCSFTVRASLEVSPEYLDFKEVPLGESKQLSIEVKNTGFDPVMYSISIPDGTSFIATETEINKTLESGKSNIHMVTFTPTTKEVNSTIISIKTSAEINKNEIQLIGKGVAVNSDLSISTNTCLVTAGLFSHILITSGNGADCLAKSDNPEVASVSIEDNWLVIYGVKRGVALITVTDTRTGKIARVAVTVNSAEMENLKLSANSTDVDVDKTVYIDILSGNGSDCTVTSSNDNIAFGYIQRHTLFINGVSPGYAVITVVDSKTLQKDTVGVTVTSPADIPAPDEEVTQAQYEAAKAGIEVDGTYLIYTQFNGTTEGAKKYYLKDDGHLTDSEEEAYVFTFGRVEGSSLFVSPGWKLDIPFSNPHLSNGATGTLPLHGQIRVDWDNNRNDWEGQVWYKNGDYYAVRSTNAVSEEWGASTFWAVLDSDANGMPEADYSLTPKFVWQLEKAEAKENPRDLMLTTESQGTTYSIYRQVIDKKDIHTNPDKWITYRSLLTLDVTKNGATTTYTLDDNIYLEEKFGYNEGQVPCIILNYQTNEIGIFCVSKDAKAGNYTMDGYYYTSPMNSISFQREKVFDNSNWGWFPYFTYDNGQLKLQHFSYKGYYAMTSTRKSVGSWSTSQGSSIRPENFKQNSIQIGHVLIISGGTDPVNTDCPARVVSVDLNSTEYHRSSSYPNQMLFSVNAKLDDMTDVTEWGVYFDNRPGKKEFAFESVSAEQTIKLYYNGQEGLLKVDVNSYIAQLDDEVGVYVKKRDKTTGTQKTLYSNLFSFRLLYDKKPSMVISNPVIVKTVITGVSDGNNEYRTDITHDYTLTGAFWISYIDSEVSGGSWTFKNSNPTWYPEADGSGQLSWVATYDDDTDLPHTNWRVLHLRNNKTINSNYVNFNGSKVLTEAWVSDSPLYTARMAERKNSAKSSQGHISFSIPEESSRGSNIQKKQEVPYKGGYLGTY